MTHALELGDRGPNGDDERTDHRPVLADGELGPWLCPRCGAEDGILRHLLAQPCVPTWPGHTLDTGLTWRALARLAVVSLLMWVGIIATVRWAWGRS